MTTVDNSKCILVLCNDPYSVRYEWVDTGDTYFKPQHARNLYDKMKLTQCIVTMHHERRTYTVGQHFVDGGGVTYYGKDMTRVINA